MRAWGHQTTDLPARRHPSGRRRVFLWLMRQTKRQDTQTKKRDTHFYGRAVVEKSAELGLGAPGLDLGDVPQFGEASAGHPFCDKKIAL
jgi:hypothetical protein